MNKFELFVLLCAMHTVFTIHPDAIFEGTTDLGQFITIGAGVNIKSYVKILDFTKINPFTSIAENSIIGSYCNIGERCFIANNVAINNYVNLGDRNVIGGDSVILGYVTTENDVKIGNGVTIFQYSKIDQLCEIQNGCILAQYSTIGRNCRIHPNTYIGEFTLIGSNSIVNERAVIHKYVELPPATNVKRMAVIIRTPSSYDLYLGSEPVERITNAQLEIATKLSAAPISSEFNNLLPGLIDAQFNALRANCEQGNAQISFEHLPSIKSLYLIRFHGLDRFKDYSQQIKGSVNNVAGQTINNGIFIQQTAGQTFINGVRVDNSAPTSLVDQLRKEFHFVSNAGYNILEPDVVRRFIQILAVEQDAARTSRTTENDNFCIMLSQIQSGEREVTSATPVGQIISTTNYY